MQLRSKTSNTSKNTYIKKKFWKAKLKWQQEQLQEERNVTLNVSKDATESDLFILDNAHLATW